jgi:hypothetical protein
MNHSLAILAESVRVRKTLANFFSLKISTFFKFPVNALLDRRSWVAIGQSCDAWKAEFPSLN